MLSLLHIENIALIESADITFGRGFNVLTGETGAGKSIVIDAIGAIMGERTSRDLIRTGSKSAFVSAVFEALPPLSWFGKHGIGPDENGQILLSRELQPDGKNSCRIGGRPMTVAQLRELGSELINIHGQHDGQQLLDGVHHLFYLDGFGAHQSEQDNFHMAYGKLVALKKKIDQLQMDETQRARKLEHLGFQINELERGNLIAGEEQGLTERRDLLRNASKLTDSAQGAHEALSGNDEQEGAIALLMEAERKLCQCEGLIITCSYSFVSILQLMPLIIKCAQTNNTGRVNLLSSTFILI